MSASQLAQTAQEIAAKPRGILAADESTGTIEKRLKSIDVVSSEDNRRDYRELLFRAEGLGEFVSGVILYDETIRQKAGDGTPLVDVIRGQNMIPGIKVDTGAKDLAGAAGEKVTEGLDGLRERLAEYRDIGARFAKWRAVITIGEGIPSDACISANAHALARYAALVQEAGLVPIVEPEVLMDGSHDIVRCYEVSEKTLKCVFAELAAQGVALDGILLKPNMVLSGKDCPDRAGIEEVADKTVQCLKDCVPGEVPGIAFLSGGQSDEDATAHLNAMNALGKFDWNLTFSYGRALQHPTLIRWGGKAENIAAAQASLLHRARMNSLATKGEYSPDMEQALAA